MHIVHSHNHRRLDEHSKRDVAFFITNKKGGYLSLGTPNFSHTQGMFFFDEEAWSPYKAVENMVINRQMTGLRNSFSTVERVYEDACEEVFSMFNNSVYYSLRNYDGEVVVDLDFRHIFDYSDQGRIYTITQEGDSVIVRYDKFTDHSLGERQYTKYLVIKGADSHRKVDQWERKSYSYDQKRGSQHEFYTYKAIAIPCSGVLNLIFSFSDSADEARAQAQSVSQNESYYLNSMKKYMNHTFDSHDLAMDVAMKALDDLVVSARPPKATHGRTGVFAGLPWFFQFWSRDELISLRALMIQGKYQVAKNILLRYADSVSEDGMVPNRLPDSQVKSIDAAGWLFVRVHDLLLDLVHKKEVDKYLTIEEVNRLKRALEKSIQGLTHHHTKDGFVVGGLQESWMDTKEAQRSGAFIEVQAFLLAMMRLHNDLSKATKSKQLFFHMENEYSGKVKAAFYKNGKLLDTLGGSIPDETPRPNIFLAFYAYPDLLSKDEWKSCFDSVLKDLWLDWGGLASIGHTTPYFSSEYTGENDRSYHNGDSWYYVNNYAAIAMARLDRQHYWKYINRIRHASREELLFSGFIGCSAEVSSAKELRSEGCLSQAWSAASFVELEHELKG